MAQVQKQASPHFQNIWIELLPDKKEEGILVKGLYPNDIFLDRLEPVLWSKSRGKQFKTSSVSLLRYYILQKGDYAEALLLRGWLRENSLLKAEIKIHHVLSCAK